MRCSRSCARREEGQHEEHAYPADVFPFTYGDATDPFLKDTDGILKRLTAEDPKLLPIVLHTQSAAEYWHRSGSLVHTDPLGKADAILPQLDRWAMCSKGPTEFCGHDPNWISTRRN